MTNPAVVSASGAFRETGPAIERPLARVVPLKAPRPRVLFVTPEMSDFVQAGGLGAVSASLPRALKRHGDVRVLLPGYRSALAKAGPLEIVAKLPGLAEAPPCSIGATTLDDGLVVYFVLCDELYRRDGSPYADPTGTDFADNDLRFARLSLAAAQLAVQGCGGWSPTCLHLNDWQTALAAGYLAWSGAKVPVLLTIHNLAHQGLFEASRIGALGVPEAAFTVEGVEFFGRLSFLKAGLNYASHIVTVSENYAREITQPEFGCGLDGLLSERASEGRLAGIVNGIDESWDPRRDTKCPYLYDPQRWKGRYADYVRGVFGLSLARAPLFAFVSRLVHQKGADLVLHAARRIIALGGQLVVMGRGAAATEAAFAALATEAPEAVGARIGFDPEGARAIFAGADFILMPSRFEPCGLSQMYAQRFGAIPIATRTGGLSETIHDGKTGFLIDRPTAGDLGSAIELACEVYGANKRLAELRRAAMALKFDWDELADRYGALYRTLGERSAISLPALR